MQHYLMILTMQNITLLKMLVSRNLCADVLLRKTISLLTYLTSSRPIPEIQQRRTGSRTQDTVSSLRQREIFFVFKYSTKGLINRKMSDI